MFYDNGPRQSVRDASASDHRRNHAQGSHLSGIHALRFDCGVKILAQKDIFPPFPILCDSEFIEASSYINIALLYILSLRFCLVLPPPSLCLMTL